MATKFCGLFPYQIAKLEAETKNPIQPLWNFKAGDIVSCMMKGRYIDPCTIQLTKDADQNMNMRNINEYITKDSIAPDEIHIISTQWVKIN